MLEINVRLIVTNQTMKVPVFMQNLLGTLIFDQISWPVTLSLSLLQSAQANHPLRK